MELFYDQDVDILRIFWGNEPIQESDELEPGLVLDYDQDGKILGVEVLNASKRIENLADCKHSGGTDPNNEDLGSKLGLVF